MSFNGLSECFAVLMQRPLHFYDGGSFFAPCLPANLLKTLLPVFLPSGLNALSDAELSIIVKDSRELAARRRRPL